MDMDQNDDNHQNNEGPSTQSVDETGLKKIIWLLENSSNYTISERNKTLVANSVCSDIVFYIQEDDEYVPAHKVFIGTGSLELFRLTFGTENSVRFGPISPIRIGNICREIFLEVVKYLYTDVASINEKN